jgi:hypothetical protein
MKWKASNIKRKVLTGFEAMIVALMVFALGGGRGEFDD